MLLGPGSYHVARTLRILRNGTQLIGSGHTQTDQGPSASATRIMSNSADATILEVGANVSARPGKLVEAVRIEGFTVDRWVDPRTPAAGIAGCVGIAMRWCVNCHAERVFSLNSCRGWLFAGTVEHYVRWCGALRGRDGSNPANDVFVGFHFETDTPTTYNGGNASVYLTYCRVFPLTEERVPTLTYGAAVRFDGGWVDVYIKGLETGAGIGYGIHGIGKGAADSGFRTENLMVTDCVLDPGGIACIQLESGGPKTAVTIANNYFATGEGSAVVLRDLAGSVTLANNQFIVAKLGAAGLRAERVAMLRSEGNIYTGYREPIALTGVGSFALRDTINGSHGPSDRPAIALSGCAGGVVDSIVGGAPSAYRSAVALSRSSGIEVRATGIEPRAVGGPKIAADGRVVGRAGPFGANCLASGIVQ